MTRRRSAVQVSLVTLAVTSALAASSMVGATGWQQLSENGKSHLYFAENTLPDAPMKLGSGDISNPQPQDKFYLTGVWLKEKAELNLSSRSNIVTTPKGKISACAP